VHKVGLNITIDFTIIMLGLQMAFPFSRYNVIYMTVPYQRLIGFAAMGLFGLDLTLQLKKLWDWNRRE